MKLLEKVRSNVVRKTVLTAALLGSFLAFFGAGTASARPRVYVAIGGPVVVYSYYGPAYGPYYAPHPYWGPVYAAPRYGYGHRYYGARHRNWDARFGCWRYR
jgi:hypothetical protein